MPYHKPGVVKNGPPHLPEWYTPAQYVEAAREVMGGIDLDPASSEIANRTVKATVFFTAQNSGLAAVWRGRVWMNPPYGAQLAKQFMQKLLRQLRPRGVTAAVMLTNNAADTAWFHEAANACSAMCFTRGRVRFQRPDGTGETPAQGQTFFYFGPDAQKFADVFGAFGLIVRRW